MRSVVFVVLHPADADNCIDGNSANARDAGRSFRCDASAKVAIVEYSSLTCPHCADFHRDVLPQIQQEYIDKGPCATSLAISRSTAWRWLRR